MGTPYVQAGDVATELPGLSNPSGSSAQLYALINSVSDQARTFCGREFWITNYTSTYRGRNNCEIFLKQTPITAVQVLELFDESQTFVLAPLATDVNGVPIVAGSPIGFWFDTTTIHLVGLRALHSERPNIYVSYSAGYAVGPLTTTTVAFTVPAVNGTVAITVVSSTPLTVGQVLYIPPAGLYSVTATGGVGGTTATIQNLGGSFNAAPGTVFQPGTQLIAQAGFSALPQDLYWSLVYEVATRYKEFDRLGVKTAAIGGETTMYNPASLQAQTKAALRNYMRVTYSYS